VEDPGSARELTRNDEVEEVEDLDIGRIAQMVQVEEGKTKRREKGDLLEFLKERIDIQITDRGVAGRRQKETLTAGV
jgi:hypothetical protein